jgi:hypothetical protein
MLPVACSWRWALPGRRYSLAGQRSGYTNLREQAPQQFQSQRTVYLRRRPGILLKAVNGKLPVFTRRQST